MPGSNTPMIIQKRMCSKKAGNENCTHETVVVKSLEKTVEIWFGRNGNFANIGMWILFFTFSAIQTVSLLFN